MVQPPVGAQLVPRLPPARYSGSVSPTATPNVGDLRDRRQVLGVGIRVVGDRTPRRRRWWAQVRGASRSAEVAKLMVEYAVTCSDMSKSALPSSV